ncbi:PDDEXK nuclease domain-containing protein [Runella salmonicolor]|uniref:PDDEXK nuclease domain-containing protein n=1 Tax=Runella salmonicolor TaxID=2950278 RepID=A0ABT1FX78_9BACT|nr:PDDEXK nuclease domain-containing protein [Runella salmonicolor]MCP1386378.1 PDDEXK nuclease domain-containing protein [Runella salmonicolor]
MEMILDDEYKEWLLGLKSKIRSMQLKAAVAVNSALIEFYWELGRMITEKQSQTKWGDKLIDQVARDLKTEFPDMAGLSNSNLKYCKRFYTFYQSSFGQQPVDQIPWGHNILIFTKSGNIDEAGFYIQKTIENGWSRDVLGMQLKSNLYERQGKAITNFKDTLPNPMSDLATQLLKDPYNFDFLAMTENYKERELENALIDNVTKFLLELGTGFAYVGKQVPMQVGDQEYFIDLLFYHLKLRAYVVIELKVTDFIPEYAGKLSFYLSVANDILRHPTDNPTIGLLICKNKNNVIAEYSLKNINQPIGVTEYQLTRLFPEEFKSSLPTIEEIETELKNSK